MKSPLFHTLFFLIVVLSILLVVAFWAVFVYSHGPGVH
jgi:hypothetical protein